MFQLSKRRRIKISDQVLSEKEKMTSIERRRRIENQYDQFIKTANNFKIQAQIKPDNNRGIVSNTTDKNSFKLDLKQDFKENLLTPTMRQINNASKNNQKESLLIQEFYSSDNQKKDFIEKQAKEEVKVNWFKKESVDKINLNQMVEDKSFSKQNCSDVADQQIKIPIYNFSSSLNKNDGSKNNSDAIFFTSQFKDFIDKQHSPEKDKQIFSKQNIVNQPAKIINSENKIEQVLKENASGKSFDISNGSSLKYSFNESGIHELINKKISNELVIDSFGNKQLSLKFIEFSNRLQMQQIMKGFINFSKLYKLEKVLEVMRKHRLYLYLMLNKQIKFELKKQQIKLDNFLSRHNDKQIQKIFFNWKNQTFLKYDKVNKLIQQKQNNLKVKIFRSFKVILFDKRINNQVQMYYLSKIFTAFKQSIEKQSKKMNVRASKFYIKSLKKRYFQHLTEGKKICQKQRQDNEIAADTYCYNLIRKAFSSWKDICPKQQKYIKLSLTTKNVFKQTLDHRLFQTRTLDFRQIK